MWQSRILNELKRLDAITGLQGANVPISFFNRKNAFGMFVPGRGKMEFRFSKPLFEDPLLPDETKVETIRQNMHTTWTMYSLGAVPMAQPGSVVAILLEQHLASTMTKQH